MLITATALLFNLCFGLSVRYYAMALFSSLMGGAISLTQIALHACPSFPIFGNPVWGLSLYTWSFLVFASSIFSVSVLLFTHSPEHETSPSLNRLEKAASAVLFVAATSLVVLTLYQCGLGDCSGTANAAHFTKR